MPMLGSDRGLATDQQYLSDNKNPNGYVTYTITVTG